MPKNLELKARINESSELHKALSKNGIKISEILKQKDVYYETKNDLLKLRVENGNYSLIKYSRNEGLGERWSEYEIIRVLDDCEKFFGEIFNKICVVEKKRELYFYNNTRIHLDEVKDLGLFIELETVVGESETDAKLEFNKAVEFLKLNIAQQIKASYKDLILEKQKSQ